MSRLIPAFTQFFDDNGDPLVNGYLHFYESGTNNDKDTFADISETIPNSNPVQLDAAGRCPNIFGSGSYNVISYTSALVQIQQFDPIVGGTETGPFSDWNASTIYDVGDFVIGSDGEVYQSLANGNQAQDPTASPSFWEHVFLIGEYNANISYASNANVIYNGELYKSLVAANLNNTPSTNPSKWEIANVFIPTDDFYVDSGAADAYVVTAVNSARNPLSYTDGMSIIFKPDNTNTGASTINVNALGAKNIKTEAGADPAAGDLTAGVAVWLIYDNAAGYFTIADLSGAGRKGVLQIAFSTDSAIASGTNNVPNDDTIPQQSETNVFDSIVFTPKNANSTLFIFYNAFLGGSANNITIATIHQDAVADAIAASLDYNGTNFGIHNILLPIAAGSVTARTYKFGGSAPSGTTYFNGNGGSSTTRRLGGVMYSVAAIIEVNL